MKFVRPFAISSALLVLASAQSVRADNLLTNPGFETGNFNGWSAVGPFLGLQSGHTGSFSAYCGAGYNDNGTVGDLFSQTIPTTPGLNYDVSLWVLGSGGSGPAEAYVLWDGGKVLDLNNPSFNSWTQLEVTVTATAETTTVGFGFRNQPAAYLLDDASVSQTPEPSALALAGMALAGFVIYRHRK
jgi:hypothetical protein